MILAGSGVDNKLSFSAASVKIKNVQKVCFFWGGGEVGHEICTQ